MNNSLYKQKYGAWAGNPKGMKPNYERCCKEICGLFAFIRQCARKRGHGEHQSFCKQHAKQRGES